MRAWKWVLASSSHAGGQAIDSQEYDVPQRNQGQDRQDGRSRGKGRGFAGMDPQAQRLIASEGGRAAHASGHAHEFTPEEARLAGRKGGEARSQVSRRRAADRAAGSDRDIPRDDGADRTGAYRDSVSAVASGAASKGMPDRGGTRG